MKDRHGCEEEREMRCDRRGRGGKYVCETDEK